MLGIFILIFLRHLNLVPSDISMIFGELVFIAPVATLVITIRLYGMDSQLELAAYDLGASKIYTFRTITFPLLFPGIFSGFLFSFILSWNNFYIDIYAAASARTLPPWIYSHMQQGFSPLIPALSVFATFAPLVVLIALVPFVFWRTAVK